MKNVTKKYSIDGFKITEFELEVEVPYEVAESVRLTDEILEFLDFENRDDIISKNKPLSSIYDDGYSGFVRSKSMKTLHDPDNSLWYLDFYKELKELCDYYKIGRRVTNGEDYYIKDFQLVVHDITVTKAIYNPHDFDDVKRGIILKFSYNYNKK